MHTDNVVTYVRIEAPHFVAGIDVKDGLVIATAPILGYMTGWPVMKAYSYCAKKGWKWQVLEPETSHE